MRPSPGASSLMRRFAFGKSGTAAALSPLGNEAHRFFLCGCDSLCGGNTQNPLRHSRLGDNPVDAAA